jgi:hypothetical protein
MGSLAWTKAFSSSDIQRAVSGTVSDVSMWGCVSGVNSQSGMNMYAKIPRSIVNTPSVKMSLELESV